ncbi:hypothetical protein BU17DRAFT_76415 [Hysterangium stoloniferum]|nr:hypothetical protein BU17DRAFT_76415 [Hysterangium stoloniferum]
MLSRILSWIFCILVLLAIVFWPRSPHEYFLRKKSIEDIKPSAKYPRNQDVDYTIAPPPAKRKRNSEALGKHTYHADGLMEVNPKGKHPIYELIATSEIQWKRKLVRQSKTLRQAVEEYRRRYGRAPPKGFEIWWDYVEFHSVQLPDEYDSIHDRLQPFWAIQPAKLRAAQPSWEAKSDTFTIGKTAESPNVVLLNDTMLGSHIGHLRVKDQIALLEDVEEYLPEFRATFTMHDGPSQFISWDLRSAAETAAAMGEYIDPESIPITSFGWAAACPPSSPIHSHVLPPLPASGAPVLAPPFPTKKTFIYNHRLSMSPCLHPTHLTLNGFLSQFHYNHQYGPSPSNTLALTFSICSSPLHSDILTSAPEQFVDSEGIGNDPDWDDKPDDRLLWRGSNTGTLARPGTEWNVSQRIRLVELATRRGGELKVLLPPDNRDASVGHGETLKIGALNAAYMDIAFSGKPTQCRDHICGELERMFEWRKRQSWGDAWMYKYIMDIDGNGWSARFKRLMSSKSLIFKSTMFPEWYTERIMPWVHYIPVQINLSDLYDILAFFRGSPNPATASEETGNDAVAEKIATAGKVWSDTFYRKEDMTAYHFRLFLEYARVMSLDRDAMSYKEDGYEEVGDD